MDSNKKDTRVTIRLSPDLIKALNSFCEVSKMTKSDAIRSILQAVLKC